MKKLATLIAVVIEKNYLFTKLPLKLFILQYICMYIRICNSYCRIY